MLRIPGIYHLIPVSFVGFFFLRTLFTYYNEDITAEAGRDKARRYLIDYYFLKNAVYALYSSCGELGGVRAGNRKTLEIDDTGENASTTQPSGQTEPELFNSRAHVAALAKRFCINNSRRENKRNNRIFVFHILPPRRFSYS